MDTLMLIEKPDFFSFRECLWFLDRGYDDCLFRIEKDAVTKLILVGTEPVLFRITDAGNMLSVQILLGEAEEAQWQTIRNYILEWFDMHTSLKPFYELLEKDKLLQYMRKDFEGLRLISIPDLFEALCWSIIGQQINLNFAYKLKRRLVESYGTAVVFDDHTYYLFPAPHLLAEVPVEELRQMQFSQSKANYLTGIARAFANNEMSREALEALPDFISQQSKLTSYKGIGVWTANYVLMKTLRVPQAIPYGDVGLLKALETHNIIKHRLETHRMERLFSKYKGWETYLVFYLWRSLKPNNGHDQPEQYKL